MLPLDALPDPVAALDLAAWLLLPFLLLGGYYRLRRGRIADGGAVDADW